MDMDKLWTPSDERLHLVQGRGMVLDPDGSVAWEEDWQLNTLADEGEEELLNVFMREQTHKNKWLAVLTATPTDTTTMATMTETAGGGYARQAFTAGGGDWAAPALNAGDFQTAGAAKTFGPATGAAWTGLTYVALVTHATSSAGKFLIYIALSAATTINVGQSFVYTTTVKAT